jgi:hypothetical protein
MTLQKENHLDSALEEQDFSEGWAERESETGESKEICLLAERIL